MNEIKKASHRKMLVKLWLVIFCMFGFGYLLVPIYNVLCKELGVNGKTGDRVTSNAGIDMERVVIIEFLSNNNGNLPGNFYPKLKKVSLHPGEIKKTSFMAVNRTNNRMVVQAIPSVTPGIAAKYLKKTECFCFARQPLDPREKVEMPLLFHVDKDLPKKINTLTLSYTWFDVTHFDGNPNQRTIGRIN